MTLHSHTVSSPLGPLTLTADESHLVALDFPGTLAATTDGAPNHPVLAQAVRELAEYFQGSRREFHTPVLLEGTPFQRSIWRALQDIPHGQTLSYGELGRRAGHPGSARAVGGAVGSNPIPIIVPCHRVMGASGAITGYSGGDGVSTKKALLRLEGVAV